MTEKTIRQLIEHSKAIRRDEYEMSPDSNHGQEVHYNGRKIGTVFKISVADEIAEQDAWQYLALALRANERGKVYAKFLGSHLTPEAAFEAIITIHSNVTIITKLDLAQNEPIR